MKRMSLLARAAESIGDGDIINVQIRRYRQWQLSQTSSLASSIIPYDSRVQCYQIIAQVFFFFLFNWWFGFFGILSAALLHGQRETLQQVMNIYPLRLI